MALSKERVGELAVLVLSELLANDKLFASSSDHGIPTNAKKINVSPEKLAEFNIFMVKHISNRRLLELSKISKVNRPIGFNPQFNLGRSSDV